MGILLRLLGQASYPLLAGASEWAERDRPAMDEVGYRVGLPSQGLQVVSVDASHALPLLGTLSRENLPLLRGAEQQEEVACRTGELLIMRLAREEGWLRG